ncbi:unnamed protein product [Phytophthora fragariaefolia]|uniref:Unnamed protein product n=1 Tax=Phytophthora fragariaefolia TaxID=1490495 RepID=A0A9W6XWE1_9STRA|nr:unnamed protein product [Phytophthora fragariaefolia]
MAKEYQVTEKARRAREYNDTLSRQERATMTQTSPSDTPAGSQEQGEDSNDTEVAIVFTQSSRIEAGRPTTRPAPDISEQTRLDFDEELLPEDSCEPDLLAGECEFETILDDRTPLRQVPNGPCANS